MINMWAMAIANGQSLSHVRGYIAPYPTLTEIGKRAAIAYYAPMAQKPWVRAVVRFLQRFGLKRRIAIWGQKRAGMRRAD